jgi:hypothetical protein
MEVSRRSGTKRVTTGPVTGLATHGNGYSGSSLVSDYASQVAAKQLQVASGTGTSSSSNSNHAGLSSATRRSLGGLSRATLSMYNDAPQEEITLDMFERAGVDRLQGQPLDCLHPLRPVCSALIGFRLH